MKGSKKQVVFKLSEIFLMTQQSIALLSPMTEAISIIRRPLSQKNRFLYDLLIFLVRSWHRKVGSFENFEGQMTSFLE